MIDMSPHVYAIYCIAWARAWRAIGVAMLSDEIAVQLVNADPRARDRLALAVRM